MPNRHSDARRNLCKVLREALNKQSVSDEDLLTVACSELETDIEKQAEHFLGHYQSDADIRAKDETYADHQNEELQKYISKLCWTVVGQNDG